MTISPNGIPRSARSLRPGEVTRNGSSRARWSPSGRTRRWSADDLEGLIRKLKAERDGEIEVAGTVLAQSVTELGLIDEYRIYLHPVVLGQGKPFFAGTPPPLRLLAHEQIDDDVVRLTYVRA